MEEMAVSTPSTPASMAFSRAISAIPVVAWQCRCRRTLWRFLISLTSSYAAIGVRIPDMSLMAMESTPVSSSCSVKSSQVCREWAGLVV